MMPAQDMTFRNNSISPAEIENGFGRRTAVNLRTVPVKAEPSLFRFKVLPVEWDNGKIEKIRKQFVVTFIPLIFGKLFQQKSVTAEEIFIGRLAMNIGLVAHDSKKKLMQNFCIAYRGILSKNNLYATGTTGRLIEEVANLSVHKYLAGHLGGIQQLGAQIEHNDIDLVIFLRDPLKPKPHEPEVNSIFRICDEHNIPLATNLATAELLILSLDRGDLD